MENNRRKVIIQMVDNILEQYIAQLEAHKEWSVSNYQEGTLKYEENVVKCNSGILYAQRIRKHLDAILTCKKAWTRKELVYRFSRGYSDTYLPFDANKKPKHNVFAQNIEELLNSMGIRTWEMLPSLSGYVLDRNRHESGALSLDKKPAVHEINLGKLTVNYGKTRDFDVFDNVPSANFKLNLKPIYKIAKEQYFNKETAIAKHTSAPLEYMNSAMVSFLRDLHYGPGIYTSTRSEAYQYQRDFAEFITNNRVDNSSASSEQIEQDNDYVV